MRRILALVLVTVFSLQTTASAASPGQMHAPNMQPLISMIEGTWLFAAVTGQSNRYAQTHWQITPFDRTTIPKNVRPPAVDRSRNAVPIVHQGVLVPNRVLEHARAGFKGPDPNGVAHTSSGSGAPVRRSAATTVTPRTVVATAAPTKKRETSGGSFSSSTTGINRWWTYEEGAVPGVGKWMANVANGNLIVQADDVDIPERGIDLAFRRTYNSQSQHDSAGSDGSVPSVYGDGWTNTFDAHIAYNATTQVISVYDIDGAQYNYTYVTSSGTWQAPPGMQGTTMAWDGGCGYQWTKKTGTTYWFNAASNMAPCASAAYAGRLFQIRGRNHANYISFSYSYSNPSNPATLTQILVAHSDGASLTLNFAEYGTCPGVAPQCYTELQSITRPDGQQITYAYNGQYPDLQEVDRPGNRTVPVLPETYGYYAASHNLSWVLSPRGTVSERANGGALADGDETQFTYNSSLQITQEDDNGVVNIKPDDETGSYLQPGASGPQVWRTEDFYYGLTDPNGYTATQMDDSDNHQSVWGYDAAGRVLDAYDWVNSSFDLLRQMQWDANNDLAASIDPRGAGYSEPNPYETDYAYDANGNTTAVGQPSVSVSVNGSMITLRPTSLYSYDANNNLIAYCDPMEANSLGKSWQSPPSQSDSLCPTSAGASYYVYDYADSNEPFGVLVNAFTPMGYERTIAYSGGEVSDNYGLPSGVTGASYTQSDGTVRTPAQTFTYDPYGNLATYNKGNGAWTLTYDSLNRLVERTDPDGVSAYTCYNLDGSVSLQRSASQYAADGSAACASVTPSASVGVSRTYDADGNELTELHHHACMAVSGCPAGLTSKWYDGADRLVEVEQPQDGNDAYAFPWMTRYIYDITGQPQSINGGGTNFLAYGNLYKTQECIQGTNVQLSGPAQAVLATPAPPANTPTAPIYSNSCSFQDLRGNTFDALDRSMTKYEVAAGSAPEQTSIYDSSGQYGLLSEKTNPTGQTDTLSYDNDGHLSTEQFSDGVTPNRSFVYDPDGREASLTSATMGTQTRTYDADSRLTSASDPNSEQDPGTIAYGYYPDGMRSSLGLSVPGLTFSQSNLFKYSYRPDGQRSSLVTAIGAGNNTFSWSYSNAGRGLSQSDPLVGMTTVNSTGVTEYTIATKTLAYDTYGRLSSLSLPRGMNPKGSIEYDLEDAEVSSTYASAATPVLQHTTRNELSGVNQTSQYANGVSCTTVGETCTFDSRSGEMLQQQALVTPGGGSPFYAVHAYTYDAAGRETADTLTCGSAAPLQATRSYDTDNHIIAQNIPASFSSNNSCTTQSPNAPNPEALSYSWAADGRLANFATTQYTGGTPPSTTNTTAAHWDGDDLLYVSLEGVGLELYVEKLGWMMQASNGVWAMVVYDRDQSGTAVDRHAGNSGSTTASFSQLTLDVVHLYGSAHAACKGGIMSGIACSGVTTNPIAATAGGASCAVPPTTNQECASAPTTGNPILDASREDGYFDGTLSLQGVRAYDPNLNQWTTPDAYSGDVHDPMSQHPYMWNGNNPVEYSDPTGYDPGAAAGTQGAISLGQTILNALGSAGQALAGAGAAITIVASRAAGPVAVIVAAAAPVTAGESQLREGVHLAEKGESEPRENGTRPEKDKKASPEEIKGIEAVTGESIEETKTGSGEGAGKLSIFRDSKGNYYVKPNDGRGPGEPIGVKKSDLPESR
jgi:RHS repeat-associated protein